VSSLGGLGDVNHGKEYSYSPGFSPIPERNGYAEPPIVARGLFRRASDLLP